MIGHMVRPMLGMMPPANKWADGPPAFMMAMPPHLHGLGLSEAQQDVVFRLLLDKVLPLREKAKSAFNAKVALHQLASADYFDTAVARTLADSHARALADMALMHAEIDAAIRNILTAEQRKLLDEALVRPEPGMGRAGKRS
jgi:Spy/CpxP family protein refolding chaperone